MAESLSFTTSTAPPPPRVNPLAVGSAPQANLATATAGELFDMFNRLVRDALGTGETDEARALRERNFSPPTYNIDHEMTLQRAREMGQAAQAVEQMDFPVPHPATRQRPTEPVQRATPDIVRQATEYISGNEGFRSAAYPDPIHGERVPTIGFGTTRNRMIDAYLQQQGLNPEQVFTIGGGVNITRQQAADMRDIYIQHSLNRMMNRADTPWFRDLPPEAQIIMLDMSFNNGANFRFPRMFEALQRGDFNAAADEILDSPYAREQVPNRARRNANAMRALAGQRQ